MAGGLARALLLEVDGLRKEFPVRRSMLGASAASVKAVDGVSFKVERGKTLGLVGESGCGKTTVGRTVLRLAEPTAGRILYDGADVTTVRGRELRRIRRRLQIVFQDPMSSLDPRMTIRDTLAEPMHFAAGLTRHEIEERVPELLRKVGLNRDHADRYPHEFSGGQRQRIGIARALATGPEFIVLDEPTSALDVSVQAQILNLLRELQAELHLTYLFISHDLSVIRHMADDVAVMYLGKIVELGPVETTFEDPQHPYTQALFSAVPVPDPERRAGRIILKGDVPSPMDPPRGCRFHPRCPRARPDCALSEPELEEKAIGQRAACFYPGKA
ncbi:MAG: dipeptide ABC transporter ATP-binding protein [Euryarchaeota archaeon]|nr:dipeptide ABC transporter ATP-binding protein [Euryarchaeota archaeon]